MIQKVYNCNAQQMNRFLYNKLSLCRVFIIDALTNYENWNFWPLTLYSGNRLRFFNIKTLLSKSLVGTFSIKNSARRGNCDSRANFLNWMCHCVLVATIKTTQAYFMACKTFGKRCFDPPTEVRLFTIKVLK